MNRRISQFGVFFFSILCLVACGPGEDLNNEGNQTVFITDATFVPSEVTAQPGESIFFINNDDSPHRILNESVENAFDDTGVFDSLIIPEGEVGSITIPDTALPGDQFLFYDEFFEDAMTPANGIITVE